MPELGKYAFVVLASYGATLVLLGGLVALSLWRAARVRRALAAAEGQSRQSGQSVQSGLTGRQHG